jgi:hypothetical protein
MCTFVTIHSAIEPPHGFLFSSIDFEFASVVAYLGGYPALGFLPEDPLLAAHAVTVVQFNLGMGASSLKLVT